MKKTLWIATFLSLGLSVMAQETKFDYFKYEGKDSRFNKTINSHNQHLNPVVSGYYPDPSICRVGNTYYLVNSYFWWRACKAGGNL